MPLNPKELRTFQFGVDADSALTGIEQGFSKWMINCLIDEGVDVTNIKGNLISVSTEVFNFWADNPTFEFVCIGSYWDAIKQKGYFFVKCLYNHNEGILPSFIFEYDLATNTSNIVCSGNPDEGFELWSYYLNFEADELITGISVVHLDSENTLLYWTQRAGLRKINIRKAKLLYLGDPDGYTAPSLQIIELIKYPPNFPPNPIRQYTDTTVVGNNIQKRFFQFSYRNVYDDYEKSAPSDWSRVNIPYFPYGTEQNYVPLFQEGQRNNVIEITLRKPFETVTHLEILIREKTSDTGLEINYDWTIYESLKVSDITWDINNEYKYLFYNDKIGQLITQEEANKIFDNVPLAAVSDTFAEDSRKYVGNVTEGFNLEPIDVEVSFVESTFINAINAGAFSLYQYNNYAPSLDTGMVALPATSDDLSVGGTITFQFNASDIYPEGTYIFEYVINEGDLDSYPASLISAISVAFVSYVPGADSTIFFVFGSDYGLDYCFWVETIPPTLEGFNMIISSYYYPHFANCAETFKNRHQHYFGIGYGDAGGRRSSVQKLDKYYYDAPMGTVLTGRFEINHVPPSWATQYYIYYGGFDAGNFYQIKILEIGTADDNGNYTVLANWLNTVYRYADITYLTYSYSVGDRIKFIYGDQIGEISGFLDLAVLSEGSDPNTIIIEGSEMLRQIAASNINFLVEIYKKSTFNELYYTIDKNDIGNAGLSTRYHKGNIQDQDFLPSALPAIQEFKGVNTYMRPRYYTYLTEVASYNFGDIVAHIETWGLLPPASQSITYYIYMYSDSIRTTQIGVATFTFSTGGFSGYGALTAEIVNQINTLGNWNSTDINFGADFFVNNFTATYHINPSDNTFVISFIGKTDYPPLFWKFALSNNSLSDSFEELDDETTSSQPQGLIFNIEDPNQSDIFVGTTTDDGGSTNGSAVTSLGKPNIVNDNFRQITRENTIWYSGQLIPESNINGLSSFSDGQFKDYSQSFGSIQKLFSTDRMLKVFMELRTGFIPINQYLTGGAGANMVLNNAQILTNMEYYEGFYGIGKHPESHAHFGFADYFIDPNNGAICRISRDGLTVISDAKNRQGNYLVRNTLYNAIKANDGNFVAAFNQRRQSYEVNVGGIVVVWNEEKNQWHGARTYNAEMMGTAGIDLLSFNNGQAYLHEANTLYNNFYQEQFDSQLWVVGNQGLMNKLYRALRTKSTTAWSAEISNDIGQFSMLIEGNFSEREGVFYAAFKQDMNTKNVTFPIINGNPLRDIAILIKLKNTSLEQEKLRYVEILQVESK